MASPSPPISLGFVFGFSGPFLCSMQYLPKGVVGVRLRPLVLCALSLAALAAAAEPQAWIEKSNQSTQLLLEVNYKFSPELATFQGQMGYDEQISDLLPGNVARQRTALVGVLAELQKRAESETNPLVQQDLSILIKAANNQIVTGDLYDRLVLNFTDLGQLEFYGEFSLLQDNIPQERRALALARLRRYTGLAPGTVPATKLAEDLYTGSQSDSTRITPYKGDIEQQIANLPRYTKGIREMFAKYGLDKAEGAPAALDALDKQLSDYGAWVKAEVLPHARSDFRLPPEIYADNPKGFGLDVSPQELISRGQVAFTEIRQEMQTIAALVAKERGFPDPDYRAVTRELKKEQLSKDEILPWYREVLGHLEDAIRTHNVVTLPSRAMDIRLGTEAENAALPAPHFNPPRLIGNTGEHGAFVLALGNPQAGGAAEDRFDDFSYKAVAWTLTAHEGRPGHELQYSAMVERGVSLARSIYAANSVNVEGWALYCEAEMKPYEPLDGQLIALQMRLHRACREFLDPMLNLGLISKERAHDILTKDVGYSEGFTREEIDRFTFQSPGQATAYYYGYQRIMQIRSIAEIALGPKFNRMAFNDFIIGQGLLPPALLEKAVREKFIPAMAGS